MNEQPERRQNAEDWHLSRHVTLSLIMALIVQAAAVVWHGSQWTAAIDQNTRDINRLYSDYAVMVKSVQEQAVQLAKIEENTRNSAIQTAALVRQLEMQANNR